MLSRSPMLALALWLLTTASPSEAGRLAIVIDDLGYSAELGRQTVELPGAFTLAILPQAPYSLQLAQAASDQGKEVMLHNPMSNTRGLPLDAGGLTGLMDKKTFLAVLAHNFERLPQARGLNNHMGSQLTQEAKAMGWLMEYLGGRGAYFVDSRTSAKSRALETAQRYRIPSLQRDVFLDHERDPVQIERQLDQALALAKKRGYAIAIGHPYPETLTQLRQLPEKLEFAGVELVPISELMTEVSNSLDRRPGRSCLAPPIRLWYRPESPEPPAVDAPQLLSQILWARSYY